MITAATKFSAHAVGIEIRRDIYEKTLAHVAAMGLSDRVRIIHGDALKTDLTGADVVTLYLLTSSNERLRPILMAAMGSAVVREGEPLMTSEDFSEYGWVEPRIPSAQIWLGAVDPDDYAKTVDKSTLPGTHSPKWAPDAEPTIKTGIMTLTLAALNLMAKKK